MDAAYPIDSHRKRKMALINKDFACLSHCAIFAKAVDPFISAREKPISVSVFVTATSIYL